MIIAHTKWGPQLYQTAFGLLSERVADGFYYDNQDDGDRAHQWEDRAKAIINVPHDHNVIAREQAAWAFLRERGDHEYEGVEEVLVGP